MSRSRLLAIIAFTFALVLTAACGGSSDDDAEPTSAPTDQPAGIAPTSEPSSSDGDSDAAAGEPEAFDVCALLSREEVQGVVGVDVGPAAPDEPLTEGGVMFLGCRYEEDGITATVTTGVIVSASEADAESLFEFGTEQYPAVEGIGDRAYNSQPIGDITVLSGRYEVSVGLFFVSEDDAAELEMARELAELLISRLP